MRLFNLQLSWLALTGCALSATMAACAPDPVEQPTTDRYEACLIGYECALECESPSEGLVELGCGPGDFDSMAPVCETTDNCAGARAECFDRCEDMFPGSNPISQEQRDCKIQCDIDFGNGSTCKDDFQAWLSERAAILQAYNNCLSPCEGRPTRDDCATNDEIGGDCDAERFARHQAVDRVQNCSINGEDCDWTCDDPVNGFYQGE